MNTNSVNEHENEEFEDEETLKEKYAELYDKIKMVEDEKADSEAEYLVPSEEEKEQSKNLAMSCVGIGDSMRAQDIKVIDVTGRTSLADYIIFMTGYNKRQIQGIANEIEKEMKRKKVQVGGIEGYDISWWILIDLNTVIVHIFYDDARKYYELDTLWQDAPVIFQGEQDNTGKIEEITDDSVDEEFQEDV